MKGKSIILTILFYFILGFSSARAQSNPALEQSFWQRQADSIMVLLQSTKDDKKRVDYLNMLSSMYCNLSFDSSVLFADRSIDLARRINYPEGLAIAIRNRGIVIETIKRDWPAAVPYYEEAMQVAEKNKLYDLTHESYSVIMNSYFYLGDFPNAMNIASKGLESAESKNDQEKILLYTNLIGIIYQRQQNYDEALKYLRRAITTAETLKYDEGLGNTYNNIADVYTEQGDSVQAFYYLTRSLEIFERLFKTDKFFRKHKLPYTYFKVGSAYKRFGNLEQALSYLLEALDYSMRIPTDKFDLANYYLQAGDIYRRLKDYPRAKENLYKGLGIATEIRHKEDTRDAYGYLAEAFADEEKYDSAFYYSQLHMRLKDSVVNEITRYRTEEIKAIYDIKEKDRELAREQNIRNMLIGLFALLLVTIGFLYNRYRLRQKNRYQRELNRQQNELFNAIAATQDQERKRIAQDIHDSLGSVLSAAKLKLSALKEGQPSLSAEQSERFQTTLKLLDEASAELRNISHNIMPATLSKLGLVAALKNLLSTISSHSGLQINFQAHDFSGRIDEETEMSIYRIVLELINNVVKHAQADKATVQLVKHPGYINISVEDNGKGFDFEKIMQMKKGIGLGNIFSRVEYLKGTINVDASVGRGTAVIIDVPG